MMSLRSTGSRERRRVPAAALAIAAALATCADSRVLSQPCTDCGDHGADRPVARWIAHACDQLGQILDDYRPRVLVRLVRERRPDPFKPTRARLRGRRHDALHRPPERGLLPMRLKRAHLSQAVHCQPIYNDAASAQPVYCQPICNEPCLWACNAPGVLRQPLLRAVDLIEAADTARLSGHQSATSLPHEHQDVRHVSRAAFLEGASSCVLVSLG
jgi:hypothetical protein